MVELGHRQSRVERRGRDSQDGLEGIIEKGNLDFAWWLATCKVSLSVVSRDEGEEERVPRWGREARGAGAVSGGSLVASMGGTTRALFTHLAIVNME